MSRSADLRMRKVPRAFENFLDDVFIEWADKLCPLLRRTGHTPNVLTTYSVLCAAAALWCLGTRRIGWFAALWALQYFWDCADGHFARKYGMTSRFGDLYDHVSDMTSFFGYLYVLWQTYHPPGWVYAVIAAHGAAMMVHAGCQQHVYTGEWAETLDLAKAACPGPEWIRLTKWFGFGTQQLVLVLAAVYAHSRARR